MIVSTEAIMLHSRKYGDSSKIVSVYTKDFGKISILAKAALKPKSKFAGSLEPFSYSFITFYRRHEKSLYLLSSSETIMSHHKIYHSYEHLATGMMILELVTKTQEEGSQNDRLFLLLKNTLEEMEQIGISPFSLYIYFYINLIAILGFGLDFKTDTQFNHDKSGKNNYLLFSLEDGKIKEQYSSVSDSLYKLSYNSFRILNDISNGSQDEIRKINIPEDARADLIHFLSRYLSFHLEKKMGFKSFNLLFEKNIL